MNSCSRKQSPKKKHTTKSINFYLLSLKYRFEQQELFKYYDRFLRINRGKQISKKAFRQNMGVLGLKSTRNISDRIFNVMDKRGTGKVSFEQFLQYMDVFIHGSQQQKAYQTFQLIAQKKKSISLSDFTDWLRSVWDMYSSLVQQNFHTSQQNISKYFRLFDINGDGEIDFEQFKRNLTLNGGQLEWFDIASQSLRQPTDNKTLETTTSIRDRILSIQDSLMECIHLLQEEEEKQNFFKKEPLIKKRGPVMMADQEKGLIGDTDEPELDLSLSDIDLSSISFADQFQSLLENGSSREKLKEKLANLQKKVAMIKQNPQINENSQDFSVRQRNQTTVNVPKTQKNVLKKSFIQWGDQDWNLILMMMLGIQKAVKIAEIGGFPQQYPTKQEFQQRLQHNLDPMKESSKKICRFRDYAPKVFYRIRESFGVSSKEYIKSLGVQKIMNSLIQGEFSSLVGLVSSGKSGSFFYFSDDSKYVLKTLTKNESKFIRRIFPAYYQHIITYPCTLIPRFYGLHHIKYCKGTLLIKKYFVVMANVFSSGYQVHCRYDLKGSTHGRTTSMNQDHTIARKDLDFTQSGLKIEVGSINAPRLVTQIAKDCEFFEREHIIDYSLLVGIHFVRNQRVPHSVKGVFWERDGGGLLSTDGENLYFIGIIDILTEYNNKKRMEHLFKGMVHGNSSISCVPPKKYSLRFQKYLQAHIQ